MQHLCGCFTYIPYYVDSDGQCCANDETDQHTLQGIPLEKKLKNILRAMHMSVRYANQLSLCVQNCPYESVR